MIRTEKFRADEEKAAEEGVMSYLFARFINTKIVAPTAKMIQEGLLDEVDMEKREVRRLYKREEIKLEKLTRELRQKIQRNRGMCDFEQMARQMYELEIWIKELKNLEIDLAMAERELVKVSVFDREQKVYEGLSQIYVNMEGRMRARNPTKSIRNYEVAKERLDTYMESYKESFRENSSFAAAEQDTKAIMARYIDEQKISMPDVPKDSFLADVAKVISSNGSSSIGISSTSNPSKSYPPPSASLVAIDSGNSSSSSSSSSGSKMIGTRGEREKYLSLQSTEEEDAELLRRFKALVDSK